MTDLKVTVERQGLMIFTAVFECFPDQITVAGTGFVGYDCPQAIE